MECSVGYVMAQRARKTGIYQSCVCLTLWSARIMCANDSLCPVFLYSILRRVALDTCSFSRNCEVCIVKRFNLSSAVAVCTRTIPGMGKYPGCVSPFCGIGRVSMT